ncbi:MAG: hypothetical protein Q4C13_07255 [Clostridia bacterium]|nr:hypothetical protein [Clostridia bacterium]
MKKRIVCMLAAFIMALALLPGAALAAEAGAPSANPYAAAAPADANSGASYAERIRLRTMVAQANCRIELMVRIAQITPWNDVPWLLRESEAIVREVFAYAARIGATVVCDYVEYTIDGQTVLIDPIRIVKL